MNAKTRLVLKVTGLAVGLMALAGSPAFAHDAHLSAADGAQAPAAAAPAVFLAAELRGANEVPPADPDGRAVEVIRIQNNTVSFAAAWLALAMPEARLISCALMCSCPAMIGVSGCSADDRSR